MLKQSSASGPPHWQVCRPFPLVGSQECRGGRTIYKHNSGTGAIRLLKCEWRSELNLFSRSFITRDCLSFFFSMLRLRYKKISWQPRYISICLGPLLVRQHTPLQDQLMFHELIPLNRIRNQISSDIISRIRYNGLLTLYSRNGPRNISESHSTNQSKIKRTERFANLHVRYLTHWMLILK